MDHANFIIMISDSIENATCQVACDAAWAGILRIGGKKQASFASENMLTARFGAPDSGLTILLKLDAVYAGY